MRLCWGQLWNELMVFVRLDDGPVQQTGQPGGRQSGQWQVPLTNMWGPKWRSKDNICQSQPHLSGQVHQPLERKKWTWKDSHATCPRSLHPFLHLTHHNICQQTGTRFKSSCVEIKHLKQNTISDCKSFLHVNSWKRVFQERVTNIRLLHPQSFLTNHQTSNQTNQQSDDNKVCLSPECVKVSAEIINSADFTADPCEDFYQYACGGWIKSNPIPDGKSSWNTFKKIWQNNLNLMR